MGGFVDRAIRARRQSTGATGNLEFLFEQGSLVIAAGWSVSSSIDLAQSVATVVVRSARPDVSATSSANGDGAGFVLVASHRDGSDERFELSNEVRVQLRTLGIDGTPVGIDGFLGAETSEPSIVSLLECVDALGPRAEEDLVALRRILLQRREHARSGLPTVPLAHVDSAVWIDALGALVVTGWRRTSSDLHLEVGAQRLRVSHIGLFESSRPDVIEQLGSGYSGFVLSAQLGGTRQDAFSLVARDGFEISVVDVIPDLLGGVSPRAAASSLFAIYTHPRDFVRRLDAGEGKIISELVKMEVSANRALGERVIIASEVADPRVSVIVPLFRRNDVLWNQFASWSSSDKALQTEFILVNDDPGSLTQVAEMVAQLSSVFGLKVTLISNEANRGFASTCNVGAAYARSEKLLFLNSDAILDDLGTVHAAADALDAFPTIGILGAVLVRPDGSIDHAGMECIYMHDRGTWFNYHPQAGCLPEDLPPVPIWETAAVTGAVLLVRANDFRGWGGLAEDFLVGDYEDSDLCWKAREGGQSVAVFGAMRAGHMPRTSMALVGDGYFMERLSLLNSWIHMTKWRTLLEARFPVSGGEWV